MFTFRGDDDLFPFVNGILAIDLGGVHSAQSGSVDLDARATELGRQTGNTYRMDIFQAERHCCDSTFHIETTLLCVNKIVIPWECSSTSAVSSLSDVDCNTRGQPRVGGLQPERPGDRCHRAPQLVTV